jgi:hypothetical protein
MNDEVSGLPLSAPERGLGGEVSPARWGVRSRRRTGDEVSPALVGEVTRPPHAVGVRMPTARMLLMEQRWHPRICSNRRGPGSTPEGRWRSAIMTGKSSGCRHNQTVAALPPAFRAAPAGWTSDRRSLLGSPDANSGPRSWRIDHLLDGAVSQPIGTHSVTTAVHGSGPASRPRWPVLRRQCLP